MDTIETKVNNSEFVKKLVLKTKDIFAGHLKLYSDPKKRPEDEFEEYGSDNRERKLKKIFKKYSHVLEYLDKQQLSRKLIYSDSVIDYCTANSITEKEYYQYHYETFLITTSSILDILASLGNTIFDLGLKEIKCNPFNYNKAKNKEKQPSASILRSFEKQIKLLKTGRHIIIHAGGFQSDKIQSIESKIFSNELIQLDTLLQEWFNDQKKIEIEKLVASIDAIMKDSLDYVFKFLDSVVIKLDKV